MKIMSEKNKSINNVLVVVNPSKKNHYALERAMKMNEILKGGVNIHLFISFQMDELRRGQGTYEFYCDNNWFAELVKPLADKKIAYSAEVFWTADWHQSVLGAVERNNIGMVIMSDHTTEQNRNGLTAAKWSLLRQSSCPVLLVHPATKLHRKTILAAVNMQTTNPRYVDLNKKVLKMARIMAAAYGAEKHIVNAYEDSMDFPDRAKLLRDTEAEQSKVHVHLGDPVSIISDIADEIDADIVIIGTLSRRGIMAAMKGNKSEEIIEKINRDVMVLN